MAKFKIVQKFPKNISLNASKPDFANIAKIYFSGTIPLNLTVPHTKKAQRLPLSVFKALANPRRITIVSRPFDI